MGGESLPSRNLGSLPCWVVILMIKTAEYSPLNRHPWIFPLVAISASMLVFAKLAEDIWQHEGFSWDIPILLTLHQASNPLWDKVMLTFTQLGGASSMAAVAALALVALFYMRRFDQMGFFAVSIGGVAILNPLLKHVFHRMRPDLWPQLTPEHDYSFPSGHAMGSMAVIAGLVILAWPTRWRWPALLLGVLFVLGVGTSRLYLGVHYPSDVLAGWVAALTWTAGVALGLSMFIKRQNA